MQPARTLSRMRRGMMFSAALAVSACAIGGCSGGSPGTAGHPGGGSGGSTTSISRPNSAIGPSAPLVRLPTSSFQQQAGGTRFIVAGHGRGDQTLGRFKVSSRQFYIQTVCKGAEPLELVGLDTEGPCTNYPGVLTTAPAHAGWFRFKIKAPAQTQWAVYITQQR
jgi:hypothetical protein